MRIALAQIQMTAATEPVRVSRHVAAIERAAAEGCEVVVFPELSLLGYHPSLARAHAITLDDAVWNPIAHACRDHGVDALVGAPLRTRGRPHIGLVHVGADGPVTSYAKRHLHADELPDFDAGDTSPFMLVRGVRIGLAICYELFVPEHGQSIVEGSPELVVASVAKHTRGITRARSVLPSLAASTGSPALLVNGVGSCEGFIAAGVSMWVRPGEAPIVMGDTPSVVAFEM